MTTETKDKINIIEQDEDSSWQVQSKPRRLGPQHSLSRQDLEEQKTKPPQADVIKKKGTRMYNICIYTKCHLKYNIS